MNSSVHGDGSTNVGADFGPDQPWRANMTTGEIYTYNVYQYNTSRVSVELEGVDR